MDFSPPVPAITRRSLASSDSTIPAIKAGERVLIRQLAQNGRHVVVIGVYGTPCDITWFEFPEQEEETLPGAESKKMEDQLIILRMAKDHAMRTSGQYATSGSVATQLNAQHNGMQRGRSHAFMNAHRRFRENSRKQGYRA